MRKTLFVKSVISYSIVIMVSMFGIFVNDTFGIGPLCGPCEHWGWTGTGWGCINICGEDCFDCNTSVIPYGCDYRCNINNCECCMEGVGGCPSCCDPAKCQECDGAGHCPVCGGDTTKTCINGNCCCAPNGCGPCDGPDIIPDNPTGCDDTSFLGPCNAHDECYGTCGSNKDTCDDNFLGDATADPPTGMEGICVNSSCNPSCFQKANEYYGAVHDLEQGQEAFDAAQACSCG